MASSYPGGFDALTNPGASDSMQTVSHSSNHTKANDAIEAVQAELGTDPAGSEATVKARLVAIESDVSDNTDITSLHKSGTGLPEGSVTAPVGSTYIRTDGDLGTGGLGDTHYVKVTGSGSTGWVPGPECDTGWRNVASEIHADTAAYIDTVNKYVIRRTGMVVQVHIDTLMESDLSGKPAPLRYSKVGASGGDLWAGFVQKYGYGNIGRYGTSSYWLKVSYYGSVTASATYRDYGQWTVSTAAWPTSLPGSAE